MIGALLSRATGLFDGFASSAVLLREAARTSRRWQTYASRAGFSGALFGVLLLGIWTAVNAPFVDISNISYAGRAIFIAFSAVLLLMAILLAPLMTSAAMIEETEDRTLEMLVLSKLRPSQILTGKVLSRILILITVVFGAMPVMAMVVTLGGVAPQQVVAVTIHTLVAVVLVGSLGAFFGLFTRSPMLAMLAAASYSVPIFWLLPIGYVVCTGNPADAAHFSLFAGPAVEDWTSPISVISYLPSLFVVIVIGTRLFELKVSSADIRKAFAAETWSTKIWAWGLGIAVVTGCTVLPMAALGAYTFRYAGNHPGPVQQAGLVLSVAVVWVWWTFALTLSTWALLRVGVDVVDAMDAILGGRGKRKRDRRDFRVWNNPILWREARPQAWGSNGVPVIATWLLIMLGMLQTGWWIIPGGSLAMGVMNTLAAMGLTLWLASRTVEEERRHKSMEVLLTTTMASPRILFGKAAGVAVPTFPLMLLSMPFIALGVPHLHMFDILEASDHNAFEWFVRGCLTWLWTLPVWAVLLAGGMFVALRIHQSRNGFSVVIGGLLAAMGVPTVLGRLFEDVPLVAVPCRMFVPPLAGEAEIWQYAFATLLWSSFALFLFVWTSLGLRRWIAAGIAVLLAVSVGMSVPAQAQQPNQPIPLQDDFLMVAEPLGEGIARPDEWAALRVKIVNRGNNAVGQLVMTERSGTETQTFSRPVELPQGVRKDVIVLYRPNASTRDREVTLQTREGRIARAAFRIEAARPEDTTIGVLGTDLLGMQKIRQAQGGVPGRAPRGYTSDPRRVYLGLIEPGVLPAHSAGYAAFDQIVWPRADPTALDPAQLAALQGFVADGGHLLLTVTENWKAVSGSPLADTLPVRFTGTEDRADLDRFVRSFGGAHRDGPFPVATAALETRPGRSTFLRAESDEGAPLWVTGTYGLGTISVVAIDPAIEPFKGNTDPELLWRTLLHLPESTSAGRTSVRTGVYRFQDGSLEPWAEPATHLDHALHVQGTLADTILGGNVRWKDPYGYNELYGTTATQEFESEVRSWLSDIPGVAPLPMTWLLAFSGLYLFVIGPLDYFALRALKKQPWTWVTFPITIVVFSAAALGGTAWMKGSQAMVSTLEVVDLLPGTNLWRGEAFVGVFATRRTRVGLRTDLDDSVTQPLEQSGYTLDTSISAGFGPGRFEYGADTWTLGYGSLRWTEPAPGNIGFEILDDGWAVTNQLPFAMTDAELVLVSPGRQQRFPIGKLAAGERKVVSPSSHVPLVQMAGDKDDDLEWMRQRAFDAPTPGRGYLDINGTRLVFLGTTDRVIDVTVEGVRPIHRNRTLIRAPLTPSLDPLQRGDAFIPGLGELQ
ncbi:MAG: ABC transporter permease [Myxococcota bacterium]